MSILALLTALLAQHARPPVGRQPLLAFYGRMCLSAAKRLNAGDVLSGYLFARAGDFLCSLRLYTESGSDTLAAEEAAVALRASARRISGSLDTYRSLLDGEWADALPANIGRPVGDPDGGGGPHCLALRLALRARSSSPFYRPRQAAANWHRKRTTERKSVVN